MAPIVARAPGTAMNNEFMCASFLGHRSNQHCSNPCHAVPESPVPTQNRSLIVPIWLEFWGVCHQGTQFLRIKSANLHVKEFRQLRTSKQTNSGGEWTAYCSRSARRRV